MGDQGRDVGEDADLTAGVVESLKCAVERSDLIPKPVIASAPAVLMWTIVPAARWNFKSSTRAARETKTDRSIAKTGVGLLMSPLMVGNVARSRRAVQGVDPQHDPVLFNGACSC